MPEAIDAVCIRCALLVPGEFRAGSYFPMREESPCRGQGKSPA